MRIWRDRTFVPSFIRLDFRKIWWKRIGCPCLFSPCLLYGGWCGMAGDWSPGGPLHHGNGCHWKLNMLQQWTQCNSVHCGTLGSIQRVRITWHYKTWNRHHFSIWRDLCIWTQMDIVSTAFVCLCPRIFPQCSTLTGVRVSSEDWVCGHYHISLPWWDTF